MLLLWAFVALAAPKCEDLEEVEFRGIVLDGQAAIDRGDVELPRALLREVDGRIACLTFAPPTRLWADLLVVRAVVAFYDGEAWENALAAALRIRPGIDRGVATGHPLAMWEPTKQPILGESAPPRLRLYVDGQKSTRVPPPQGTYLVQKTDGRYWNSMVVSDEAVPESWITSGVEQPRRVAVWGRLGLVAGGGTLTQGTNWGSDLYVDYALGDRQHFAAGPAGDLQVTILSPVGFLVQGSVPVMLQSPGYDLRGASIWTYEGFTIGGGVGTTSVDTFEGDPLEPVHQTQMLRYGHGTVMQRVGGLVNWDVSLTLGAGAALRMGDVSAGVLLPNVGGETFRIGGVVRGRTGRFGQAGLEDRELTATSSRAMLRLDWVWGEY